MEGLMLYGQPITKMKTIGSGNFSQVYLAENKSGKTAAIKKVKKSAKDKTAYQLAKSQATILNGLFSPNILQLIGTHEEHNYFYIIEKFIDGQCLSTILKRKKYLNLQTADKIFKGVVKAMEYLVSKKIMHRDLKPDNIMVSDKNDVVLIDLGFATFFSANDDCSLRQRFGTPFYMSPEMMGRKTYNSKSDIWSLGILYYEMICGGLPFYGGSDAQLYKDITQHKGDIFKKHDKVPGRTKNLIKSCLTIDIKKRINWSQLFSQCKLLGTGNDKSLKNSREISFQDNAVCCSCCMC